MSINLDARRTKHDSEAGNLSPRAVGGFRSRRRGAEFAVDMGDALRVLAALFFPSRVSEMVALATSTTSATGISLGGLVTITVPALFYAWLLKNISRLFIQAHTLSDDAAHRRALAITYLGLAENKDLKMSESERALILNALFRPLPQHSGEEGPPNGLLDLTRSKP